MSDERKAIIIKEIQYWKKNHLLPEQYCDFLLALYTQGDGTATEEQSIKAADPSRIRLVHVLIISTNIFLLPITFIVLYFTHLPIEMQVVITALMIGLGFGIFYYVKTKLLLTSAYSFFIWLGIIFIATVSLSNQLFHSSIVTAGITIIQLSSWIWLGFQKKRMLLISAGIVGLVSCFLYYIV